MSHILSLDVSTTCIGYTILNAETGELVLMSHFEHKKVLDIYDFAKLFYVILMVDLKNKYDIKSVYIEEPKKGFAESKTSVDTILLLNRFNGICSWMIYDIFNIKPIHINESTARKKCGLQMLPVKKVKISAKQQAFEQMSKREPFANYKWDLKRTGKMKDYHYDEMDSFIIGRAGYLIYHVQ